MARNAEELKLCTISKFDELVVHTYYNEDCVEKDKHVAIGDVCYPLKFYKAIQACSKNEYEKMVGGL